jgi:hypothetical protein
MARYNKLLDFDKIQLVDNDTLLIFKIIEVRINNLNE